MRPSRLAMTNFGAYRERAEIDFGKLGPFFLVCGKTGSGKTTIFDALTYALYGKVPGSREGLESQLWSQHAAPGDKPLVEFEFFLGDEEFRAVRVPPYRRPKRGGGLADVPPEACVYQRMGGGWALRADSIRDANALIESRIGLTVDEFSKIILLPQGEFQRFLQMPSPERVQVLEKLFPVALHGAVTELAREQDRDAAKAVRDLDDEIARRAVEAEEDPEGRLAALVAESAKLKTAADEATEALSSKRLALGLAREACAREEKARLARERLAVLEKESAGAKARLDRIATARAAAAALPAIETEERSALLLAKAREESALAVRALAGLEAEGSSMDAAKARRLALADELQSLDRERGELESALIAWKKLVEADALCRNAEAEERSARAAHEDCIAREAGLVARFAGLAVDSATESAARAALGNASLARQTAAERLRQAKELVALAAKAEQSAREEARLGLELSRAEKKLDEARSAFELAESRFLRDRAAGLARELEEGAPCPVCGSLHHPAPAAGTGESVSEAERIKLKAALDKALAAQASAGTSLESARKLLGENRKTLAQAVSLYAAFPSPDLAPGTGAPDPGSFAGPGIDRVEATLSDPAGEFEAAKKRLVAAEKTEAFLRLKVDDLETRKVEAEKLTLQLSSLRLSLSAAAGALAVAMQKSASAKASRNAASDHSGGADPSPRIEALRHKRGLAEAELTRIDKSVEDWEGRIAGARAMQAAAARRLAALEEEHAILVSQTESAVIARGFAHRDRVRAAFLPEDALARLETEASAYATAIAAARAEVEALGQEAGADRASLPDLPALENQVAEAAALAEERRGSLEKAGIRVERLSALVAELRNLTARRKEAGERSAALHGLSELLSGNLAGRRLPFKSFVLGMYFRTVVRHASLRLCEMSDGRYTLVADEGSARGQGRIGLEILVRDSYTGQSRPAGTLSGGERFITAVSLALGLADTIRLRSGGVSLDAIFIDEGFGSLDEEALDRALDVLDRIRGARVIGIVSHVAELRSRIPSQIVVTKGRSGSRLEIAG